MYGHNAVGGALNLTTKLPTDDVAFSARLTLGEFETSRAEVRVSGPLIRSRIQAGASVVRASSEGYVQDLNHPNNPLGGTDVGAARAVVRVLFSDAAELRVRGDYAAGDPTPLFYAKVLAFKAGFAADSPSDLHQVRTSEPARGDYVHKGASAQFIWRPTPATVLTSLSAVRHFDYDIRIDTDSTELDLSISNTHEIHDQLSQEFTLTGERRRIRWTGSIFAFKDVNRQPTLSELLFAGLNNTLNPRVEGRNIAAFAQANVRMSPRLGAVVGLRYSRDRKTMDNAGRTMAGERPLLVPISRLDLGRRVDTEVQARLPDQRAHIRLLIGDSRIQERRLQCQCGRSARRVRAGVGVDVPGGDQMGVAERAGSSERSRVFHGLHRPPGADACSSRGVRHRERGDRHDSRPRARS